VIVPYGGNIVGKHREFGGSPDDPRDVGIIPSEVPILYWDRVETMDGVSDVSVGE